MTPPALATRARPGSSNSNRPIQNTDPRAFRFDMMTPQERRDTLDGLGKPGSPGYQKFINSPRMARSSGAIMPDGGAIGT